VAGLAVAVNPFGVPAFGLPRLTWLRVGTALLAVLLAWDYLSSKRGIRSSGSLPLGALIASGIVSTAFSVSPIPSLVGDYLRWEGLWTLAGYWVLFGAALRWGRTRKLFVLLWPALLAGSVVVSILGLAEFFQVFQLGQAMDLFCAAGFGTSKAVSSRIVSTCGNAAFLGGYLAMTTPLAVGLALSDDLPRPWWRPLATGAAVLSGITLVLTYARAAWLGGAIGVLVVIAALKPDRRRLVQAGVACLAALIIAAGAAAATGRWSIPERVLSSVDLSSGSLPQRLGILGDTLPMVRDHWLVGVGLDAYAYVFPSYASPELLRTASGGNLRNDRAHNDLLQVLATQGVIGLAAWIWFLVAYALAAVRGIRRAPSGWTRAVLVGAGAATLAYLVQAQLEFSTFVVSPLFWALAGIVWSASAERTDAPAWRPVPGVRTAAVSGAGALAVLTAVAAVSFFFADVAYNRGIAALYARDAGAAITAYRQAVSLDPVEPLYRAQLGAALVSASPGDPSRAPELLEEAAALFETAHRLAPADATGDFLAGNAYLEFGARKGKPELAAASIKAYERGLAKEPRAVEALTQLGRAYAFSERWNDALAVWQRALAVTGDNANLFAYSARAYERLGDPTRARTLYERSLMIDPKNETALQGIRSLEGTPTP
jgi:tetratricopeptide (TPR) repeat protein